MNWAAQRAAADKGLEEMGVDHELASEASTPDEATWGLSPAAIAAQEKAMRLAGGGEAR